MKTVSSPHHRNAFPWGSEAKRPLRMGTGILRRRMVEITTITRIRLEEFLQYMHDDRDIPLNTATY